MEGYSTTFRRIFDELRPGFFGKRERERILESLKKNKLFQTALTHTLI